MAQILFVYLLTLAQWDVSGKAGEVPLPLPLGPNMPETDWPRFEFTLFGSSPTGFTSRTVIWESETDDFCIHSVRTSTAKNAMKIGKLFSYCLGTAWSCECLLPTTYWLPEFMLVSDGIPWKTSHWPQASGAASRRSLFAFHRD